jgi:N-acetylneuraminic acid mutarotase
MKIPAGILPLLFPVLAVGQNYPGMGGGDAQNMMLQMQKMQACMQSVDQSRLKAYEQQANKVQAEVKTLCASGKRDEAQQKAVAFAQEFAGDPDTMKMMECSKMMSGAMPAMPFMDQANESDNSVKHVCDQ